MFKFIWKYCWENNPTMLNINATPEPMPMSVNMFKFQVIIDLHALIKITNKHKIQQVTIE